MIITHVFFFAVSSAKARIVKCLINVLNEWMLRTDKHEPLGTLCCRGERADWRSFRWVLRTLGVKLPSIELGVSNCLA